ncbi:hypothetical protein Dxin01_04263 [Deinococcus xinjiangensis]|uniref:Uncharacterized protein n=1 Tax=Deinococcus xinjiangensis TaxID=457454 RepID=A0ABP9VM60_9DEIO
MKQLNDFQALCTLGTVPKVYKPAPAQGDNANRGNRILLFYPLLWTTPNGQTQMITGSSISPLSNEIQEHLRPGEPILVTGALQKHEGKTRLRVRDIVRPVSKCKAIHVDTVQHAFYSLSGGYSDVCLRGIVGQDSQPKGDQYATFLHVPVEDNSTTMHIPLVTDVPLTNNQRVSIKHGEFVRLLNESEEEAYVFAQYRPASGQSHGTLEIVSRLTTPAIDVKERHMR